MYLLLLPESMQSQTLQSHQQSPALLPRPSSAGLSGSACSRQDRHQKSVQHTEIMFNPTTEASPCLLNALQQHTGLSLNKVAYD